MYRNKEIQEIGSRRAVYRPQFSAPNYHGQTTANLGHSPASDSVASNSAQQAPPPHLAKHGGNPNPLKRLFKKTPLTMRVVVSVFTVLYVASIILPIQQAKSTLDKYDLTKLENTLLTPPIDRYADKLVFDQQGQKFIFNKDYKPGAEVGGQSISPKIGAEFGAGEDSAVTVSDPINNVSMTFKPQFDVDAPMKNKNRIVYPVKNLNASKVYTLKGSGLKEDIILHSFQKDEISFEYELELPPGTDVQIEQDGSIGIYGVDSYLLGSVSTGTEQDAKLLEDARNNAEKRNLIFRIPAPFVVETGKKTTQAKAWYSLDNKKLTVHATNLKNATYPLSIDPSVYVETASKLMRGNNESNIEFDVDNELIQKGRTTGARFDEWQTATASDASRWGSGTAVAGGNVYSVGGALSDTAEYKLPGTTRYVVPAGITSITVKVWGAGGGGGGAAADRAGGAGGGGGYVTSTLAVTAGEVLNIYVGEGGDGGRYTGVDEMGDGGDGGGYSGVFRSSTPLLVAAGGGGGGGANGDSLNAGRAAGSAGGAGGGTSGVAGSSNGATTGGGAGTSGSGGAAGSSTTSGGTAGTSLQGGTGASVANTFGEGSLNGGGPGGNGITGALSANKRPGGGGGGGGYYGGGGGGSANADYNGGGGGGGGSSYTTGSSVTNTAGSGTTPGNSADSDRSGAGTGGAGGVAGPAFGTKGSPGLVLVSASGSASTATSSVYWAKFNTATTAIESPNPGAGTCSNWCTDSDYDLPANRVGLSLVAYNGFLYAIGGSNGTTRQNTIYIAKLGANGEPSLWHPTGSTPVYWYASTNTLSTERSYSSAFAYNNRLYLLGGQTTASTGGVTTVEYANISPTGDIGSWTSTGMVALPSARHNHTVQVYNDRVYLIGGNSSGTLQNSVHYIKLASDGTMQGSWTATTSFSTARMAWGGNFSVVWGGYLYIAGGCTALSSGNCSTSASDIQLASINADGTLTDWNTISAVTNQRIGHGFVAWRNALYLVGGCVTQNTGTGVCSKGTSTAEFGVINQDGDASTVSNSTASGVGNCVSAGWFDCDLPPVGNSAGEGGRMSGSAIINNGFIYHIGGCRATGGGQVCYVGAGASRSSDTISYSSIAADGTLTRPGSCVGTFYGSWCVDNTNTINGSTGVSASGHAVFNNVIYVVGGTDGTQWQETVWRNPLNADGSLGSWSTQTFTNLDLGAAKGYQYVFTRANPSSASTYPGNLYVIGGCSGVLAADNGLDCTGVNYTQVYKCNITTSGSLEEADANDCTTSGQLQIDSEPGTGGSQGLGVMAGTVYANYIYLIGGQSPNEQERGEVIYAKIDNSNNIVDADGETVTDDIWTLADYELDPSRRRGVAFGYNGYLYGLAGYSDGASLNDLLFAKIDVSDGSIGPFTTSKVTVNQRWDLRAVVNNGYVYTLGGCSVGEPPADCTTMTGTVQTFQLYNNYSGSPASYSAGANLFTTDRLGASSAVLNGYIYIAGGCTTTAAGVCTAATDNVQYASLSSTGAIGSWANTTDSTLPAVRTFGQLEAAGGTLYYIGGQSSTATDERAEVYYGTPSSGDVSAWNTAANGLPAARTQLSATVWDSRIYVTGGLDGSAAVSSTVYVSPLLTSGGDIASAWTTSTSFNVARSGTTAVAYANNLYIFGGHDGTNYLNDVQYASLGYKTGTISQSGTTVTGSGTTFTSAMVGRTLQYSDGSKATITAYTSATSITVDASKTVAGGAIYVIQDGSVGAWSYTTSLPTRLRQADGFAVNGFMYLYGGRSADTTCASNTIVAPISANTTIATGNNPTGLGEWFETNVKYTGDRYAAAVVQNEGKAYVLGGGCGASGTLTGANRIVQTSLQSQPQIAKYSRMIDTDTDIFPTKWLMNGLDNSIGARWYMRYRSSTASTAAWGQETNFGVVTLGNPEDYIPRDGAGTDTNFSRYHYMNVTIDSSQAFGYPEDVERGPTIADLSLFFTSDPSKRLRHGKTFTGGELQPLDTPF